MYNSQPKQKAVYQMGRKTATRHSRWQRVFFSAMENTREAGIQSDINRLHFVDNHVDCFAVVNIFTGSPPARG